MTQDDDVEGVDFALAVYREENVWRVEEIADERLHDVESLAADLRRWPGDFGSLGLISIDEDFFVLARVAGPHVRLLLSDVTAATEWPLARSVIETLDLPMPDEDDDPEPEADPAEDLQVRRGRMLRGRGQPSGEPQRATRRMVLVGMGLQLRHRRLG